MRQRSTGAFRDNNIGSGRQFSSGEQLMISFRVLFFVTAALMVLSGCSDKCGDPREDGFFGGLSGVYGGCYDKRLAEKNNQLDAEKRRAEELKLQAMALNAQYERLKHEIDSYENRVAQVPTRTPKQRDEARRLSDDFRKAKRKVTDAQTYVSQNPGGSPSEQAKIEQAKQEFNQLEQDCKKTFEQAKAFVKAIETENKTID